MTAVISDVHGNSPALRAILQDIRSHGIEEILSLGDVVNGVDPVGCVELLVEAGASCIRGNAEENLLTPDIDGFPWVDSENWAWIVPMFSWIAGKLPPDLFEIIRSWPSEMVQSDAWLIHDSPADRLDFPGIFEGLPEQYNTLVWHGSGISRNEDDIRYRENFRILAESNIKQLFVGHTHEPWISNFGKTAVCNVGSAGMPLDSNPRPSWALWDNDRTTIHRIEYDIAEFERIAKSSGYPSVKQRYIEMFRQGIHWRMV